MQTEIADCKVRKLNRKNRVLGVVRGLISDFSADGYPLVDCYMNRSSTPTPALSLTHLTVQDLGREVVLMFEDGDLSRPIIMGLVQPPITKAQVDEQRLDLTASEQMTLRCGKASLTLTSAGKVLIRGEYVSSSSSGVNCIKGAAVRIN